VLQNRYSLHYKLCYRTGTVCITNCATEQIQSALQTVLQNRYSLHYKLCYRTGTVCITNCATQQVPSALQTLLHHRYSLHYKLCYTTGTICITNCATQQVQCALPEVQHSAHILGKDVVQVGLRVDVLITPVQEGLPLAFRHLHTKPHIGRETVQKTEMWFRIPELELNFTLLESVRSSSVEHPVGARKII